MTAPSATPLDAIDWVRLFFGFEGRARRVHFWIAWAILFVLGLLLSLGLGPFAALVVLWSNLAIKVKRLHDMGMSGWLVLAPIIVNIGTLMIGVSLIGIAGFMNLGALESDDPALVLTTLANTFGPAILLFALSFLIQLAFLLWVGVSDSQPGENRFGPNPKGL